MAGKTDPGQRSSLHDHVWSANSASRGKSPRGRSPHSSSSSSGNDGLEELDTFAEGAIRRQELKQAMQKAYIKKGSHANAERVYVFPSPPKCQESIPLPPMTHFDLHATPCPLDSSCSDTSFWSDATVKPQHLDGDTDGAETASERTPARYQAPLQPLSTQTEPSVSSEATSVPSGPVSAFTPVEHDASALRISTSTASSMPSSTSAKPPSAHAPPMSASSSTFTHFDFLSSLAESSRPPLLRSSSEDMVSRPSQRSNGPTVPPAGYERGKTLSQSAISPAVVRSTSQQRSRSTAAPARHAVAVRHDQDLSRISSARSSFSDKGPDRVLAAPTSFDMPRQALSLSHASSPLLSHAQALQGMPGPVTASAFRETSPVLQQTPAVDAAVADAVRKAAALVRANTGLRPESGPLTHGAGASVMSSGGCGLMGACGNGHFGEVIRDKAANIFHELLPQCTSALEDDVVSIVEYGATNSCSAVLAKPIIGRIAQLRHDLHPPPVGALETCEPPSYTVTHAAEAGADFRTLMRQLDAPSDASYAHTAPNVFTSFAAKSFGAQVAPPRSVSVGYSLMDLHWRRMVPVPGISVLDAGASEFSAFLHTRAREFKKDGLLLLAFITKAEEERPSLLGTRLARSSPAAVHHPGLPERPSLISERDGATQDSSSSGASPFPDSEASETVATQSTAPTTVASAQSSPATIFGKLPKLPTSRKRSGSYTHNRNTSFSSSVHVKHPDVWSAMSHLMAPCIQRLVSIGQIKSDTAQRLLALPLFPRTWSQTQRVLDAVRDEWGVEWSCAMGSNDGATSKTRGERHEEALHLSHPAYTAYKATTMSRVQCAEHALQFVRTMYEQHFRDVLADVGKLSRGRIEEVLDALLEVLREKIEEPDRPQLEMEFDVCLLALRRL